MTTAISGIYIIKCATNGLVYVGSSYNTGRRRREHWQHLSRGKHDNRHLQNTWNKYGGEAFTFDVIQPCIVEHLLATEQSFLDYYRRFSFCANVSQVAGAPMSGRRHTPEARVKMSAAMRGKIRTPAHCANISAAKRGMPGRAHTPEARAKMSAVKRGMPGRAHTPETRAKIAKAHRGRTHTPETRAKIAKAQRGRLCPTKGKCLVNGHFVDHHD